MRMNSNLFRAIRKGYLLEMIKYCRAYGWKFFFIDNFVSWWRYRKEVCPCCGRDTYSDRLKIENPMCMCGAQKNCPKCNKPRIYYDGWHCINDKCQ